jgi:GPH family glycoside/pentoside/hexuronide:cation symporter
MSIKAEDKIPVWQKIAFSLGVNTDFYATSLLTGTLWMPFFNIGMGMNPTMLGMILMIYRAWDAVTDPVMGNISDNARTRWGRRRPFMVAGAILMVLVYPAFWYMPMELSEHAKNMYLIIVGLLFFTVFTMWSMPFYGLQLELTPDYDERTRLTAYMSVFGKLGSLAGAWILALATSSLFTNPETGQGDILIGMKYVCWLICFFILIFALSPALFVKERVYRKEAAFQAKEPFWSSVKDSFSCKPLWNLIGVSFFLVLGGSSVGALGQYINFYYVFDGDLSAAAVLMGWKQTLIVVVGIGLIPVWTKLSERFDKRIMVAGLLVTGMVGHVLNIFTMRPDMPYLQLVNGVLEACTLSAIWMFLPSMKADCADYDEVSTHKRREGSINSFYSWFIKASLTASMGIGGLVLDLSGFDVKNPHQSSDVLSSMFAMYIIIPLVVWTITLLLACYYPLSREKMNVIRQDLESRRGQL